MTPPSERWKRFQWGTVWSRAKLMRLDYNILRDNYGNGRLRAALKVLALVCGYSVRPRRGWLIPSDEYPGEMWP